MNRVIATTQTGKIEGTIEEGYKQHKFYAFKGIPYAKPPIGKLRFRDPEPAEPWIGIRKTMNYGSCCAQFDRYTNEVKGDEDCLYLNVFTKDLKFRDGRPVIVWIHPSIFLFGSGDDWLSGPDYFMSKDVVIVTMNHRLGIFGFLNMDVEEASGNQGLKDQLMALEWIRDNIANFGGDPSNVTISGSSAGASCAHFLAISPLAKGFFHKAIFQSGTALHPWAFFSNPKPFVYELCESLGHSGNDSKSIIEFLTTVDARQLVIAQDKLQSNDMVRFVWPFGPSIDDKSKKSLIPVHPELAVAEGVQIPLMIGQTSNEGLIHKKELIKGIEMLDTDFHKFFHPELVNTLKNLYHLTPKSIKRMYFKNDLIMEDKLKSLIDFFGDLYFIEGIHRTVKIQVEKSCSPTYFYQFSYDKKVPSINNTTSNVRITCGSHLSELQYLFKMQYLQERLGNVNETLEENRIIEQMTELWVNFATTGNPTPEISDLISVHWQPVDNKTDFRYLNISEELRMDTMLSLEQYYIRGERSANK